MRWLSVGRKAACVLSSACVVLLTATGCDWIERPGAIYDGRVANVARMPLDEQEWQPQAVVYCDTHRTYGGTWVGYTRAGFDSEATARAALCPLPASPSAEGSWTIIEQASVSESGKVVLFASVKAEQPMASWPIEPELAWSCSLGRATSRTSDIDVSLWWVISPHDLLGKWSGTYALPALAAKTDPTDATWLASPSEAEALRLANPRELTDAFRSRRVLESGGATVPTVTVTIESQSVEFDVTGWEEALLPFFRECHPPEAA